MYVASPEGLTGKSAVALGLLDALTREVGSVGVFRPLTTVGAGGEVDLVVDLLVSQPGIKQTYEEALGVTYEAARDNADEALHVIVERFGQLTDRFEVIVVVGSDFADVSTGTELSFNAKIAANLGSPVVLVVHGRERTPDQIRSAADGALTELRSNHAQPVAVIANRVDPDQAGEVRAALAGLPDLVTAAIGENPVLSAPTFRALAAAADAELGAGQRELDGPGVAGSDRGGDEPAERAGSAAARRHGDRPERPDRPHPGPDAGPPVRHLPRPGGHLADRWLPAAGHHPPAVRGRSPGSAHRAHRARHLHHGRAVDAGPRTDDQGVHEQDRIRPADLRRRS